jgi:hypothetical protein
MFEVAPQVGLECWQLLFVEDLWGYWLMGIDCGKCGKLRLYCEELIIMLVETTELCIVITLVVLLLVVKLCHQC